MSWIMVDVETDGPVPGLFSMTELGAVYIDPGGKLDKSFYAKFAPISNEFQQGALDVTGYSREETLKFPDPNIGMMEFNGWLQGIKSIDGSVRFISDNNGFDWQFVNYYFWDFHDFNPFGHSSTNLGSLYKGMERSMKANFKYLRKTKHTHHPVDDARGNAEALLAMRKMGLVFPL